MKLNYFDRQKWQFHMAPSNRKKGKLELSNNGECLSFTCMGLSYFIGIVSVSLIITASDREYFDFRFTDEKTESQKNSVISSSS